MQKGLRDHGREHTPVNPLLTVKNKIVILQLSHFRHSYQPVELLSEF